MYGERELVKLLLKHGTKVDIEDVVRVNITSRLHEGLIDSLQGKERVCVVMCAYVTINSSNLGMCECAYHMLNFPISLAYIASLVPWPSHVFTVHKKIRKAWSTW